MSDRSKHVATALRLRALAARLTTDINALRNPGVAQQNLTARRARIADDMRRRGDRLLLVQRAMHRMAGYHDRAVPMTVGEAAGLEPYDALRTRKAFEELPNDVLTALAGGPVVEELADQVRRLERELLGVRIPGFFPTPRTVIREQLLPLADIERHHRVLEPSAGKGDIADAILDICPDVELDVCEINASLRAILQAKQHRILAERNFLQVTDDDGYDRIVMNPPFEQGQDMDHVRHAFELLKPTGRLVAIVSEGVFNRSGKREQGFRSWLGSIHAGEGEVLEHGTFTGREAFRQTGVASRVLVLDKACLAAQGVA